MAKAFTIQMFYGRKFGNRGPEFSEKSEFSLNQYVLFLDKGNGCNLNDIAFPLDHISSERETNKISIILRRFF